MQIHELNNYSGSLDASAYLAVDNGNDTGKVSVPQLFLSTETEIDTLEADLNARIDNIIAGGAAPSEAEIIDARLGADNTVYPSLGDAIRSQVDYLQSDVLLSFDGKRTFMGMGSFGQGGLDANTDFLPSQHWRVSSDAPMTLDREIMVSVENGFRWGYVVSGDPGSWQGWFTTPHAIPSGIPIAIQIARVTEDTSEYANIGDFVRTLTFEDLTSYTSNENKSNLLAFEEYINPYYKTIEKYGNNYFFASGIFTVASGTPTIDSENPLTVTIGSAPAGIKTAAYIELDPAQSNLCVDVAEQTKASMRVTLAFFNASGAYISQVDKDLSGGKAFISAAIPANARKWAVFFNFYAVNTYIFESINAYYSSDQILEKTFRDVINAETGILGCKWSAMGDSLTAPSTLGVSVKNYVDYVAESLGVIATNLGWGGTGYINQGGASKAFWQRYNTIPADTDVLTVFGSLNDLDLAYNNLGGLKDNNTTTLYGCMNTFLNGVYSINAGMRVGIILPTPWQWMNRRYPGEITTLKTEQYINALLDFAKFNSLPVLNLFDESGMHPWDDSFKTAYYKNADGTHPNTQGHYRFIYPKVKCFLTELVAK